MAMPSSCDAAMSRPAPTRNECPSHSATVSAAPSGKLAVTNDDQRQHVRRPRSTRSRSARPDVAHDLDQDGDRQRRAECEQERQRVVVGERLAEDVAENRRVRRPDDGSDRDPRREPGPWLSGDAGREGEDRSPAGDEAGGDQQEPAALTDLMLRPFDARLRLRLSFAAALDASAEAEADHVRRVVAEERAARAGEDDEQQRLVAGAGGDTADDDGRLARHYGDDRVEEGDAEDDQQEPPLRRDLVEPVGEVGEDVGDDSRGEHGVRLTGGVSGRQAAGDHRHRRLEQRRPSRRSSCRR